MAMVYAAINFCPSISRMFSSVQERYAATIRDRSHCSRAVANRIELVLVGGVEIPWVG